jgi:cell division transport system permease protein
MSRSKPTYLTAILSVALVLFLLGFFALMTLHGRQLVALFREKIDIWMELRPNLSEADIAAVVAQVRSKDFVKKETVTFISKAQATKTMQEDLGDESLLSDAPDLLRDVVRFNVQAKAFNIENFEAWKSELQQDTLVAELYFEAANTGNVGENLNNLSLIALGLSLLLVFAAVTLIHNTIRLAMYSNRFIIKNQELVGASWGFISRPYIQRGIWNGILSAVLAIAGLILVTAWLYRVMPDLQQLQDLNGTLLVFLTLIGMGVLISGLSTYFVVHKFLKMRIDDLY